MKATHFIEQYRISNGSVRNAPVRPIAEMQGALEYTKSREPWIKTIAIFKITIKKP